MNRWMRGCVVVLMAACAAPRPDAGGGGGAFTSERMHVATRGAGPDIIFVHGVGGNRDVWSVVADSLDEQFRVHGIQINGFGGAGPGANADGPVVAPLAEEIARYIRESKLQRPAIVGHSMGGAIGMMIAARHPDLVGRLMVIDEPPFLGAAFGAPGAPMDSIRKIADGLRAGMLAAPADSPTVLDQMVPTMTRNDSAKRVLLAYSRASHRPTVANSMHELIVTDLRPELSKITAPVTVLYVTPAGIPMKAAQFDEMMRQSYANAKGARLVRIDSSAHYIQIDRPARVVAEIRSFMAR